MISKASLLGVEASINDRLRSGINDPYDLLGTARGTYLEGYGAVFTFEVNVVLIAPPNLGPFLPKITEKDIASLHERKLQKIVLLKGAMRELMVNASRSLTGLPPDERIVMEAFLFNYKWENSRGLPWRVVLTAPKQKLLDAVNRHASDKELAEIVQDDEL